MTEAISRETAIPKNRGLPVAGVGPILLRIEMDGAASSEAPETVVADPRSVE